MTKETDCSLSILKSLQPDVVDLWFSALDYRINNQNFNIKGGKDMNIKNLPGWYTYTEVDTRTLHSSPMCTCTVRSTLYSSPMCTCTVISTLYSYSPMCKCTVRSTLYSSLMCKCTVSVLFF